MHGGGEVWAVKFHPAQPNKFVVSGGEDGNACVWDLEGGAAAAAAAAAAAPAAPSIRNLGTDPEFQGAAIVGVDVADLDDARSTAVLVAWSGGAFGIVV